ncbi:MAG: pyridoxamine 5'-phosphate oxidase family protein [Chloroflexota bacterium]
MTRQPPDGTGRPADARGPVPDPLPLLSTPRLERPSAPSYGIPDGLAGTLPWSWAEERLGAAETYWVATTRPDGRPHLMPVWAAWHAGRLWFEGGAATRRARNLALKPAITVGIELPGDGAMVVEGSADCHLGVAPGLVDALVAAFSKYDVPPRSYRVDPANWEDPAGGIWMVTPRIVFGWTSFPADATRWRFAGG